MCADDTCCSIMCCMKLSNMCVTCVVCGTERPVLSATSSDLTWTSWNLPTNAVKWCPNSITFYLLLYLYSIASILLKTCFKSDLNKCMTCRQLVNRHVNWGCDKLFLVDNMFVTSARLFLFITCQRLAGKLEVMWFGLKQWGLSNIYSN